LSYVLLNYITSFKCLQTCRQLKKSRLKISANVVKKEKKYKNPTPDPYGQKKRGDILPPLSISILNLME